MSSFEKETPTTISTLGGEMSALPKIQRGSGSITHRREGKYKPTRKVISNGKELRKT